MNPQNLDMQAITKELVQLNASVFAAQETNIHWDPITKYQIYQQSKRMAAQIKNRHCIQSGTGGRLVQTWWHTTTYT